MRKQISLLMVLAVALTAPAVDLSAATANQRAAFRAERKATAAANAAARRAAAADTKATKLEARAALLAARAHPPVQNVAGNRIAFLSPSDIPTPEDFVQIHSLEDADDAAEFASWLTLTPEELAAAKQAYLAAQAFEDAMEAEMLASLTPEERAAYRAAELAADAIERAAQLALIAAEKAAYANMTFAERVAYNDALELEEQELEDDWIGLTPEQLAIAIAAHQAQEAAEHAAEYAAWAAMTPEERLAAREADEALDDDADSPDEIEIEDGEDFE